MPGHLVAAELDLAGVHTPARTSRPKGRTAATAAWAQRMARAGLSNVASSPSD
jgi:hypothetical protein